MDRLLVYGGSPLRGVVAVASAKNAVLPILAATLLTEEPCTITNVPLLEDVSTMVRLLSSMGVSVARQGRRIAVAASDRVGKEAPYDIVRKMRASYYVLGPLLARFGEARVSLPGGCAIGPRPVDLHLKGIEALGARVRIEHGYIHARGRPLRGGTVLLEGPNGPSVGATANTMMAAVLARGTTVIDGAACEPEVTDLARFLTGMGANVEGAGTPTIRIRGVRRLRGVAHRPIPDRIEAGTLAVAAAITRGRVEISGCRPEQMTAVVDTLRATGADVEAGRKKLLVASEDRPLGVNISTRPYPGFPTDLQAQFTALLTTGRGTSVVTENIFESRFLHALELNRMGARIDINGNMAVIQGVERLSSAQVMASDLRASAALVLAALAARGQSEILRIYHLDRGYEQLERKLAALGARVKRVTG
ncbi:UDP-N-acetylglucosamine 1-carboxyvinyltransferase [candidate division WOR-3 bacterium]|nr:UDP-N-acetylglucosamine 1-carboxyvinyltransferase [candidate division WOR-3 bacterium]